MQAVVVQPGACSGREDGHLGGAGWGEGGVHRCVECSGGPCALECSFKLELHPWEVHMRVQRYERARPTESLNPSRVIQASLACITLASAPPSGTHLQLQQASAGQARGVRPALPHQVKGDDVLAPGPVKRGGGWCTGEAWLQEVLVRWGDCLCGLCTM